MSMTLQLINEAAQTQISADGGLLDLINQKNGDVRSTIRGVSVTVAIVVVLVVSVASRFAIARVLISALSAAACLYVIFNITEVKDTVQDEINGAPTLPSPTATTHAHDSQPQPVTRS